MTKILLIEDSTDISTALSITLKKRGYEVETAENGVVGIEKIQSQNPDVVITDMLMPEKDGFEVIDFLRELPNRPKVILISGGSNKVPVEMILEASKDIADVQLMKPFSNKQLLDHLEKISA